MPDQDLTPAQRKLNPEALAAMEAVLKTTEFRFADVVSAGDAVTGVRGSCYRWADGLLQKARKKGTITLLPGRAGWTVVS